ncbi:MAG: ethanolamine permease [Bdellovibrionaceae bacterium]|nr:ethanolamine permease [Pseudobdellovibrionaceae bacterium]|tara:strand:+ start:834 stop:2156 length:1323 start_codon:yes stop_codon:yes gene_type:complete
MNDSFHKTLGPLMVWGLGVGYVISGMYFGWNLGLVEGGPYGMGVATLFVTLMYVCFVLSYAELCCALPRAGGAFVYTSRALGNGWGFLAGMAQVVEFVFAPPAIAFAIGAYFHLFFPEISAITIAVFAYLLFTGLNIYGVKQSAVFELVITVIAVIEILIFTGIAAPEFSFEAFQKNPLPNGWWGVFRAIPFAIWFYLAIEGIANIAEETINPKRDLLIGFSSAMTTLVILAFLVFFSSVGVSGWEAIVYDPKTGSLSDSPLPLALSQIVGGNHFFYHLLITIGLFGLVASFHGIILVAGRATFEFGRLGYAPKILGTLLSQRKTPMWALLCNLGIGLIALFTGKTSEIITIAVFGALTLYVLSTYSMIRLRAKEPQLHRPFKVPGYPWVPRIALLLSFIALVSLFISQPKEGIIYVSLLSGGGLWYRLIVPSSLKKQEV